MTNKLKAFLASLTPRERIAYMIFIPLAAIAIPLRMVYDLWLHGLACR